jgi:hypothetical protein
VNRTTAKALEIANFSLDHPVQIGFVFGPKVQSVDSGLLRYSGLERIRKPATNSILRDFLALSTAPDSAIETFAKRWCAFVLCPEHGLPPGHSPTCSFPNPAYAAAESVEHWRRIAFTFESIAKVAAELSVNRPGDAADWARIEAFTAISRPFPVTTILDVGLPRRNLLATVRLEFQTFMRWLIQVSKLTIRFSFSEKKAHWELDFDTPASTPNLLAVLTFRLMLAISSRTEGFARCSSCRKLYFPDRRPNPNRRNYCSKCGVQASWRDSKRVRRTGSC